MIRDLYGQIPADKIGAQIGRSQNAVRRRAGVLGVNFQTTFPCRLGEHKARRWSEEDTALLKRWYRRKSIPELCAMFGRTKGQLSQKACTLGLKRRTPHYEGRVVIDWHPDGGAKRVCIIKDGRKKSFAKHVWETHNGSVPAGKKVVVKTGNPLDCRRVENLELVSDRMMAYRNRGLLTEDEAIAYDIIGDIKQKLKEV